MLRASLLLAVMIVQLAVITILYCRHGSDGHGVVTVVVPQNDMTPLHYATGKDAGVSKVS